MLRVKGARYSFVGFGVGLLFRRLGDRDRDFERYLDPEEDRDADFCLIRRAGLRDLDTDLEGERFVGFTNGLGGGDFDFTLGRPAGGIALFLLSFGSFTVSFPSTFISFVSFFTLRFSKHKIAVNLSKL
jgi:hypothetical protein